MLKKAGGGASFDTPPSVRGVWFYAERLPSILVLRLSVVALRLVVVLLVLVLILLVLLILVLIIHCILPPCFSAAVPLH